MTLSEIKAAVRRGDTVHWGNPGYTVVVDSTDSWYIVHRHNTIGLTWTDGVTLNGDPDDFYIA